MRRLGSALLLLVTITVSIYCICILGVYASPERILIRIQGKGRDFAGQVWGQPVVVPEFSFVVVEGQPKEGVLQCQADEKAAEGRKTIILRCEDGVVLRLEGISWR